MESRPAGVTPEISLQMKTRAYLLMLFVVAVWDRPSSSSNPPRRLDAAAFNLVRMTLASPSSRSSIIARSVPSAAVKSY